MCVCFFITPSCGQTHSDFRGKTDTISTKGMQLTPSTPHPSSLLPSLPFSLSFSHYYFLSSSSCSFSSTSVCFSSLSENPCFWTSIRVCQSSMGSARATKTVEAECDESTYPPTDVSRIQSHSLIVTHPLHKGWGYRRDGGLGLKIKYMT